MGLHLMFSENILLKWGSVIVMSNFCATDKG